MMDSRKPRRTSTYSTRAAAGPTSGASRSPLNSVNTSAGMEPRPNATWLPTATDRKTAVQTATADACGARGRVGEAGVSANQEAAWRCVPAGSRAAREQGQQRSMLGNRAARRAVPRQAGGPAGRAHRGGGHAALREGAQVAHDVVHLHALGSKIRRGRPGRPGEGARMVWCACTCSASVREVGGGREGAGSGGVSGGGGAQQAGRA